MLKLDLSNNAANFLTELEAKQSRQLWNKLVALMKDPRPVDSIAIGKGYFRVSVGEYRIVYSFNKDTVNVVAVGKRNDDDAADLLLKRLKLKQMEEKDMKGYKRHPVRPAEFSIRQAEQVWPE